MEIIKHGNKAKTQTCLNCGCEFVFNENDKKHAYINSPFDLQLFDSYDYINCPECKKEIKV